MTDEREFREFNVFGGVQKEQIKTDEKTTYTNTYDHSGNPAMIEGNVPHNGSLVIPLNSADGKEIINQYSSSFVDRVKDVNWKDLEEHAKRNGYENDVRAAHKRFEELSGYKAKLKQILGKVGISLPDEDTRPVNNNDILEDRDNSR